MAFHHVMIAQAIRINDRLPEPLGCRAPGMIFLWYFFWVKKNLSVSSKHWHLGLFAFGSRFARFSTRKGWNLHFFTNFSPSSTVPTGRALDLWTASLNFADFCSICFFHPTLLKEPISFAIGLTLATTIQSVETNAVFAGGLRQNFEDTSRMLRFFQNPWECGPLRQRCAAKR